MPKHLHIGKMGEDLACRFLVKKNYSVVCRNYRKKYGEIDIVAKKGSKIHFVEVKTVSRENSIKEEKYRPEENVHPWKIRRLSRVFQTYLSENTLKDKEEWVFDVIVVFLSEEKRKAEVRFIENIIINLDDMGKN